MIDLVGEYCLAENRYYDADHAQELTMREIKAKTTLLL